MSRLKLCTVKKDLVIVETDNLLMWVKTDKKKDKFLMGSAKKISIGNDEVELYTVLANMFCPPMEPISPKTVDRIKKR